MQPNQTLTNATNLDSKAIQHHAIHRTVSFDVPPQEILTKDSVTVAVDAVVYYNIR